MPKTSKKVQSAWTQPSENLEQLMYAVAFVIARRQMREKWASRLQVPIASMA